MFTSFIARLNRIPLILILSFGTFLLFVAYLAFSDSWQRGIQRLQKEAESQIDVFSARFFSPSEKYSYFPEVVGQYQVIENVLLHQHNTFLIGKANQFLARLNKKAGSNLIYVMGLDGTTIASSNWKEQDSLVGKNYAFRPYFKEALNKGAGRFYAMGVTTNVPGYYLSHLVKRNGVPSGVVVVKVDISDVDVQREKSGHEVIVTDKRGVIFLSSREDWKYRPIRELGDKETERLNNTRQYEGVLSEPLPITHTKIIKGDEQLITLTDEKRWYGDENHSYLVKSRMLPNKEWTVHLLTPTRAIKKRASQAAIMAAGGVALIGFLILYLNQLRIHTCERRDSELALRHSHEALSQAHLLLEERNRKLELLTEELHLKSITDTLTGLFNRRLFLETVSKLVSAANRHGTPLSVIMIDVDHFKQINDARGHPAGDKVLQTLAMLYKEEMRETDVLARYGGEEFIIALPHTDAPQAQIVAERIRIKVMQSPVTVDDEPIATTISIGISEYRPSEAGLGEAIQRADKALYEAKNGGRNKVVISG